MVSLMPNPGSVVRLTTGSIGIVTRCVALPDGGRDDRVWDGLLERAVTEWDIAEVIYEPDR